MLGRILFAVPVVAAAAFALLVLIGLWDRYEQETAALGFGGVFERLAWEAGFAGNPTVRIDDLAAHEFKVGLRFAFGGGEACCAAMK